MIWDTKNPKLHYRGICLSDDNIFVETTSKRFDTELDAEKYASNISETRQPRVICVKRTVK